MKVRDSYKQTDAGIIPNDWDSTLLGDKTVKIGSGITPTGGEKVYTKQGHPFIRSQNIGWGTLLLDDIAFINDQVHETFQSTEIKENDVFLNITGASIGRSAVADVSIVKGNVNQHVCIIRTKQEQLDPKFLNQILLSRAGQQQIDSFQAGGNRQGLNFGQISSFWLPLPPLPEQRAIAAALTDMDALLTAQEKLIAKKRAVKQGVMQELLTGQRRLPGFNGIWETKRLGKIGSFSKGKGLAKEYISSAGQWPAIPYTAIYTDYAEVIDHARICYFTNSVSGTVVINSPHLLIASSSNMLENIGKVTAYTGHADVAVGGDIILYQTNADVRFLSYLLNTRLHRKKIVFLSQGSTIRHVYTSTFQNYEINLPLIEEQTAVAAVLTDMDAEIVALEQKQSKSRALKQGMMQELLTGRARFV